MEESTLTVEIRTLVDTFHAIRAKAEDRKAGIAQRRGYTPLQANAIAKALTYFGMAVQLDEMAARVIRATFPPENAEDILASMRRVATEAKNIPAVSKHLQ